MKRLVCLLMFLMAVSLLYSQSRDVSKDVSLIAGVDTTYWTRVKSKASVDFSWEFTNFSHNDALLEIFYAVIDDLTGDTIPISANKLVFPVTLDKTNAMYMNIWDALADTVNIVALKAEDWNYDLVGAKLTKVSVTSGNLKQRIRK